MSGYFVAPIVEGHGEVQAVPILLERILKELHEDVYIRVNPPLRVKVGSFLKDRDYFAKYFDLAARKAKQNEKGSVLILLDCDDGCPAELGPKLAAGAAAVRPDVPVIVALAQREFETWFLAAARSLRGVCGLPVDLEPPRGLQSIRDAKGWLSERMPLKYNEPNHQPSLTIRFSLEEAASAPSFARLRRKLHEMFSQ